MAEVLTHEDDEILFVDYNTPDDFPTFPEAIADTLTAKAREILRILRVRSSLHESLYAHRTHLKTVEPVARNVAVRRSNPRNQWVLTTNTDMIFVPKAGKSITDQVSSLHAGLYCAPRFEIPETLWEDFDRKDPAGVIADLRVLGPAMYLNEIVLGNDDVLYDAPGDFQLMPRDELFEIDGFNEGMMLGWHIDFNISKRLRLKLGNILDAEPIVSGYHCDHTRQVTPMHAHGSRTNSIEEFVHNVKAPDLPEQRDSWGLIGHDLEEISLDHATSRLFRTTLRQVLPMASGNPTRVAYRHETYDREPVNVAHVITFLLDMFASAPRDTRLAWIGMQGELLNLFQHCWATHGFSNPIDAIENPGLEPTRLQAAETIVISFGAPNVCGAAEEPLVVKAFWVAIQQERARLAAGLAPRRILAVNAIHNRFESLVLSTLSCAKTPFLTRMRHGYVLPSAFEFPMNLIEQMHVGGAGQREGREIRTTGSAGHVMHGPYRVLVPGVYEFQVDLHISAVKGCRSDSKAKLHLEVVLNESVQAERQFDLQAGMHRLRSPRVKVTDDVVQVVQVRLHSDRSRAIVIKSVYVSQKQGSPRRWLLK
ncbi:hypothetical protein [Synechococcus sp. BA-132 BA5]|uniref:hypothetical protein n=1 Tax=Synechococcus sp. BA-132 BA5 TaxID=3110252 RepID=UPI002B21E71F|nr:hypothetical protein [Synechococcus sp. BA-132 BA5]MEA5417415.1 hypothetical protein [Synechococcus sp. BA-132 BA5]